ncbi:MAG TPA: tetratricopeptide repeat protein, partial [Kaistia sp.]|nr:tetratricopeptide repeat protein [Kaistia sp.]
MTLQQCSWSIAATVRVSGGRLLKRQLAAFALAAVVACGAMGAAAQTDNQAAARERYDQLFQTMLERPADLDVMFEFAALATRLGEFDAAISTLERMLIYNADLPRVRLELGALYMRVGADEMARVYLQDALQAPEVPQPVRARIETLLAEIDQRTARNVFAGSVFGGMRYQTNANTGPVSGQVQVVQVGGGTATTPIDDEFKADEDFNAFLSGSLVHRYNFDSPYGEWWETRLTGYGAWQFDFTDLDVALAEIQTGPRIALNPGDWKGTSLRVYALGNVVDLGRRLLYATVGGGAEISQVINDQAIVDLGY